MLARKFCVIIYVVLIFFYCNGVEAQTVKHDTAAQNSIQFEMDYTSNNVYAGRTDSVVWPYINPQIKYKSKTGWYAEGQLFYVPKSGNSRIDMTMLGAGYETQNSDTTWEANFYINKYFTSKNSFSVQSTLKAEAGAGVQYNTGNLMLGVDAFMLFTSQTDFTTSLNVKYAVPLSESEEWTLTPSFTLNAGTSNFYKDYYQNKKFSPRRRIVNNMPLLKIQPHPFNVLSYDWQLSLEYDNTKLGFFITPQFALPVNPLVYSINNGINYRTEKLSATWWLEAGIYVQLLK